jgi:polyphosphate kinase 2
MTNKELKEIYDDELIRLQTELVKWQEHVKSTGEKFVIIFEGRDTAGKGGMIKRIMERMNPRIVKNVALGVPSDREKTQWYFQRYVEHLPAGGEIVIFDRSWYNRAGVEKVMGFCSDKEYREFLKVCPIFERSLVHADIKVIKYWLSVSSDEQDKRFKERLNNPLKRWKFSNMDLLSREKWQDYSKAKDNMLAATDMNFAPWYMVDTNNKKRGRLNCIQHLLSLVDYDELDLEKIKLPKRLVEIDHSERPPKDHQNWIKDCY